MTSRPPLMSVAEALARLLEGAGPVGSETVPLHDANNRVLAEDIHALRTQPPFSASAMDGYAVRSADLSKQGAELTVIGEVAAGYVFERTVTAGQAVRIFTGAPLPDGADAILIQEDAEQIGSARIRAKEAVSAGTYVRAAGLDFSDGDRLLEKGRVLDAGALSLAASGNHAALPVYKKPKVGILATGDELRAPGSSLEAGQIIASNSYGVAAIAGQIGAEIIDLGIAKDSEASLTNALNAGVKAQCDILVTLGGASVGDHDLVRSSFQKAGMAINFWKIAMQPGKPLMSGNLGDMRILGLPGNPVSSLVCAHVFLVPLIAAMAGKEHRATRQTATLTTPVKPNGNREQYARAIVSKDASGFSAEVFENQDSSILTFYAQANALVVRPPHAPAAQIGDDVEFIALRDTDIT